MTQPPSCTTSYLGTTIPVTTTQAEPAPILDMPNDVTALFFHCLDLQDLEVCSLACRSWNRLLGLESVWESLLKNHFSGRTITLRVGETYHSAYKKQHRLILNLANFRFGFSTLNCFGCKKLAIGDEKIIVASSGEDSHSYTNIQVLDIHSLNKLRSFRISIPDISSMSVGSGKIHFLIHNMSGDNKFLCADLGSLLIPQSKIEFQETTHPLLLENIASGNNEFYATNAFQSTIYHHDSVQGFTPLKGRTTVQTTSIALTDGKLYVGGTLGTIEIWDTATKQSIGFFNAHKEYTDAISICGNYFFSYGVKELKLWDVNSYRCISSLKFNWAGGSFTSSIAFSGEKLFLRLEISSKLSPLVSMSSNAHRIGIMDFTADHKTILKEIANFLEKNHSESLPFALERFSKMPDSVKIKIYAEHNEILRREYDVPNETLTEHAEELFFDQNGWGSSPLIKAQAICNYLAAPKSLEHPRETERKNESINNPKQGE